MFNIGGPVVNRRQDGMSVSTPAPVGGWNAKDALANMPITDAVTLVNWWPTPAYLQLRQGYIKYSTGYPAAVETVASYKGAASKLFGISGGNVYDASSQGLIGAAVFSGLNSSRFQYSNFTTTGGVRYLVMFSGTDSPLYYDGTTWAQITAATTPGITGTTFSPSEFNNVIAHKSRLWLTRRNTLEAYYLPVGSVGGAASLFDFRPVFRRGGVIVDIDTWSVDDGSGFDDRLVITTDQGEIAIYQGTDPSSANTWSLAGVYYIGGIVGSRSLCKFGGDVLAICQYGLLPLSTLLQSTVINADKTLSDKIQYAVSNAISANGALFGWETLSFPKANMLLLNVPTSATTFEQYAMNTITGAWARFTGWNASCWELYFDDPYFGGPGYIGKAWANYDDAGSSISTDLKTAFNYFNEPGVLKQWTLARPIISTDGSPSIAYGLNVDFDDSDVVGIPSFTASATATWDISTWS